MDSINAPEKFNIKVATILGLVCFFSNGLGLVATICLNLKNFQPIIIQTIIAIAFSFIVNTILFCTIHLHLKNYKTYMISIIAINGYVCFPVMLYFLGSSFFGYYCLLAIYAGFATIKKTSRLKSIAIIFLADIVYTVSSVADNQFLSIDEAIKIKHIITITISYIALYTVSLNLYKNYVKEMITIVEHEHKLKMLAERDGLTNAYNRKTLEQDVLKKRNVQFAIMIDIDHFKQVNDIYGHKRGDEVLIVLAGIIYPYREYKFQLYRYGGEEFCILSMYDKETTFIKLKSIVDKVRSILWIGDRPVTISLGMAEVVGTVEKTIEEADENLYLAKNNGRNRLYYKKQSYFAI